jgi:PhnB protein
MEGIKPYISFKGNCSEAMDFYKDKLGAEILFSQTYGESPMADKAPGNGDKIMHCSIKIGDSVIMACDNVFEEQNATVVTSLKSKTRP